MDKWNVIFLVSGWYLFAIGAKMAQLQYYVLGGWIGNYFVDWIPMIILGLILIVKSSRNIAKGLKGKKRKKEMVNK